MSFICPTSIQSRSLWIGEIENWMDEKYISNNFLHYGYKVKSVKIIRDKNTKIVVGYGFVEFTTPELAKEVLQNGKAYEAFEKWIANQGGDLSKLKVSDKVMYLKSKKDGKITHISALACGKLSILTLT